MNALLPLMLVPLLVWVAVWCHLWVLDGRVKRLEQDLVRSETREAEDDV